MYNKQKTEYENRSGDWSSDVCSSDLAAVRMGMVGGMGKTQTVGATAYSLDGFVIGTVTGGQDAGKLTSVNVSVTGSSSESGWYNATTAVVGTPIKVGKNAQNQDSGIAFTQGQYQVVMTGKFSDNTSQVIYTGTVPV